MMTPHLGCAAARSASRARSREDQRTRRARRSALLVVGSCLALLAQAAPQAFADPLILNEYNAVAGDGFLNGGTLEADDSCQPGEPCTPRADSFFGRVEGNGGDWFELVVIADGLDIRGWELAIADESGPRESLFFSDAPLFSNLRAGTFITVGQDLSDDASYDPATDDWWIHVQASDTASGTYITASNFPVNNADWQLTIKDAQGRTMSGPTGEGVHPIESISSSEIFELRADPSALITRDSDRYGDGQASTFGGPNRFSRGSLLQDMSALRSMAPFSDIDFDGHADCSDNCREVANVDQADGDQDGFGNRCDGDLDQDGDVDMADEALYASAAPSDPRIDLDGDGDVDSADDGIFESLLGAAPGPGSAPAGSCPLPFPTDRMFPDDRILDVEIRIPGADWEALRTQGLTFTAFAEETCGEQIWERAFTWFQADVRVDGMPLAGVGVRKKGFIGSQSNDKPSLKIDFGRYNGGERLAGFTRMTFNNGQQDASFLNQCMGYGLMTEIGLPTSRCAFATIRVADENGDNVQELGLYAHVESPDERFLSRFFEDPTGKLYEGTLGDFWPGPYRTVIEPKTDEAEADTTEIDALTFALANEDDATLLATIESLIDLDDFLTYWAAEGLIGHWDGYADNQNNWYIYIDPDTGLIRFIPWGVDDILGGARLQLRPGSGDGNTTNAIVPRAALTRRLYALPAVRAQYLARLQSLLDTVWHEAALLDEVDRLKLLIEPIVGGAPSFDDEVEDMRAFIRDRREHVEAEIADPPEGFEDQADHYCDLFGGSGPVDPPPGGPQIATRIDELQITGRDTEGMAVDFLDDFDSNAFFFAPDYREACGKIQPLDQGGGSLALGERTADCGGFQSLTYLPQLVGELSVRARFVWSTPLSGGGLGLSVTNDVGDNASLIFTRFNGPPLGDAGIIVLSVDGEVVNGFPPIAELGILPGSLFDDLEGVDTTFELELLLRPDETVLLPHGRYRFGNDEFTELGPSPLGALEDRGALDLTAPLDTGVIVFQTIPEPGAAALQACALGLLAWMARKRGRSRERALGTRA